jgi:hypothetical protein
VGHYVLIEGTFKRGLDPEGSSPNAINFEIDDVTKLSTLGRNGKEALCWPSKERK